MINNIFQVSALLGGMILVIFLFVLLADFIDNKKTKSNTTVHFEPEKHWEKMPGGLRRIRVPGGWIYKDSIPGHSIALTYVAKPTNGEYK